MAEELTPHYGADCPAAVVYRASWPDERIYRGTLATIEAQLGAQPVERTALIMVGRTLARVGGKLENMVTMTVFINDGRNGDHFVQIRNEFFKDGRYPCSALLTISNFARPGCLIEIQGVAVV